MMFAVWFTVGWVGHACLWTYSLNNLYGRPIPKWFLKPYRLGCGLVIVGFPLEIWLADQFAHPLLAIAYLVVCGLIGGILFPVITVGRLMRPTPPSVLSEHTPTFCTCPVSFTPCKA